MPASEPRLHHQCGCERFPATGKYANKRSDEPPIELEERSVVRLALIGAWDNDRLSANGHFGFSNGFPVSITATTAAVTNSTAKHRATQMHT